jgi:predicted HicB family RNase H-like nuclease
MNAGSLRSPTSLHRRILELARKEGVAMNQTINSALAERT